MLRAQRSLNIHSFLGGESKTQSGGQEEEKEDADLKKYRRLYIWFNSLAVSAHIINVIAITIMYETNLKDIPRNYVFVSPIAKLYRTSHALIVANKDTSKCTDVDNSPHFKATTKALASFNTEHELFPPRVAYQNFMDLYNFEGTTTIRYDMPGSELNLDHMMICFCFLSALFQLVHGIILITWKKYDLPRFIHYLDSGVRILFPAHGHGHGSECRYHRAVHSHQPWRAVLWNEHTGNVHRGYDPLCRVY